VTSASVEAIFRALNEAGVRYLVAGGLAVVAHGYQRFTNDVDLVIHLERENVLRALQALKALGYKPVVAAVRLEDLADPQQRENWIAEKNAMVFQLYSDQHRLTPIDIFIKEPFAFERAARDAHYDVIADLRIPFVGLEDLLQMKRSAGRPQDVADVDELERIARDRARGFKR
jgi:predicted nucleotidyltransferase